MTDLDFKIGQRRRWNADAPSSFPAGEVFVITTLNATITPLSSVFIAYADGRGDFFSAGVIDKHSQIVPSTIKWIAVQTRSNFQVNAFTTHGLFDTEESAKTYAAQSLGWGPSEFTFHSITVHEGTS